MKLFTDNKIDNATVFSSDAFVNYPASNVKASELSKIFRGDESINFDITGNGSPKNISEAYTNDIDDPTDFTQATWTKIADAVAASSTETINGLSFSLLRGTTGTPSPIFRQTHVLANTATKKVISIILRNVSTTGDLLFEFEQTGSVDVVKGRATINLATKTVTENEGDVKYTWFDDDTVEIYIISQTGETGFTSWVWEIRPPAAGDTDQEFLATAAMLVDETDVLFPFVDGTHSADDIDETQTMPGRFILDTILDFRMPYDTSTSGYLWTWNTDLTHRLYLRYEAAIDKFRLFWVDAGTGRILLSQQFDNGDSFIDINQRIRFTVFLNLISGGQNDSMFICTPLETGTINIDNSFDAAPDIKSSTFTTLSIGHDGTSATQPDSVYEYLRIYEWSGTKPTITDSQDITDYLEGKKILLDKTYFDRLTATDLLIAGSTINDGDIITLRGNDVDSFNSGTPVDETVTWSKDIITHTFTKASYQYWRVIVNSSNIIDIAYMYLGEPTVTPFLSQEIANSHRTDTVKDRTPLGNTYGDIRDKYEMVSINWPKILTATDKPALKEAFDRVDISKPFFVTFDESSLDLDTLYVTIDTNGLHFVYLRNPVYSKASLSLIEEK